MQGVEGAGDCQADHGGRRRWVSYGTLWECTVQLRMEVWLGPD